MRVYRHVICRNGDLSTTFEESFARARLFHAFVERAAAIGVNEHAVDSCISFSIEANVIRFVAGSSLFFAASLP